MGLILISAAGTLVGCSGSINTDGGEPTGIVITRSDCGGFEVAERSGWAPTDKTCLRWEYDSEGTLQLFHLNAGMNCCTDLAAIVCLDNYAITVREDETGQYCFCQCLYDIEYSITDLPLGRYTIVVEEKYLPEGDDSLSVTIDLAEKPSGQVCVNRTRYPWESPEVGMGPIEGRLIFRVLEKNGRDNSPQEPFPILCVATEQVFPCRNFGIRSNVRGETDHITFYARGIDTPHICLTALGPATATHRLQLAAREYGLHLVGAGFRDAYQLQVTDSSISVQGDATDHTAPGCRTFWRYRPKSFAYLCGTLTEDAWICDNFLDSLTASVSLTEFHFPDTGLAPYPRSSGGYYYDMPGRYFIYANDDAFAQAGDVLRRYTETVLKGRHGVGLQLLNFRGERHASWLMD